MGFFTKKIFLYITTTGSVLTAVLIMLQQYNLCRRGTFCREATDVIEPVNMLLIGSVALLPLAVIFLFVSGRAFEAWKKFAVIGVPIVLILTYLITRPAGGSNFFAMDWSLYFLAVIYGLFFLISLTIIVVSAIRNR